MRQVTLYRYEVGIKQMQQAADGRFDLVCIPVCETEATAMSKTDMRKAIQDAGYKCPRGTEVYATKIARIRYYFELEDLISISKRRVNEPLETGLSVADTDEF